MSENSIIAGGGIPGPSRFGVLSHLVMAMALACVSFQFGCMGTAEHDWFFVLVAVSAAVAAIVYIVLAYRMSKKVKAMGPEKQTGKRRTWWRSMNDRRIE